MSNNVKMYRIEVNIPEEYVVKLRDALQPTGACKVGKYDNCMAITHVEGYWRPLNGSNPFLGKIGNIERGNEVKVEFRCPATDVKTVISIIRRIHPYETPVIDIIPLHNEFFD